MQVFQYKNFTIKSYDQLPSTNDLAFDLAVSGQISHNHVILAKTQTAGKGRFDRVWQSPLGNLYFSIVIRSDTQAAEIPLLSFVASVAMRIAIEKCDGNRNSILHKWPNDILINQKKVCGILLKSHLLQDRSDFVVIGIGVNIDSHPENTIYPASNLKAEKITANPEILLKIFLDEFSDLYENWRHYGFKATRNLWLQNAFNLNKKITVNLPDKKLSGLFGDLDYNGNLILKLSNQEILKISSGEIYEIAK